jgi:hypothetical protein
MSGHPFAFSSAPLRRVDSVQFGILSPDEIVRVILLLGKSVFFINTSFYIESNVGSKDRVS